jgi:type VI secretion system secreted protein Hcp
MDILVLEIEGISGNSTIASHPNGIELYGVTLGVQLPISALPTGQQRATGRPNFHAITVTKLVDLATPVLYGACAQGKVFPKIKISQGRNVGDAFMPLTVYTLEEAIIESVSTSSGADQGSETVSFHGTVFDIQYTVQKADGAKGGNASFAWSLKENKATTPAKQTAAS